MARIEDRKPGEERRGLEAVGLERLRHAEWELLAAGIGLLLVAVGTFGPWRTEQLSSTVGFGSDEGKFFILCVLVAGIAIWRAIEVRGGGELLLAMATATVIVAGAVRIVVNIANSDEELRAVFGDLPDNFEAPQAGWGLWLVLLGAFIALLCSGLALYRRSLMVA